jgi:hypothetical protein
MNIVGTNKIKTPEVRNYSGYFKAKEAKDAANPDWARETGMHSTNTYDTYNNGMMEE